MKHNEKLLIDYIKLIKEDVGDYYGYDSYGGMGGMGGGSNDVLYNAFVKPFVDIIGVTAGSAKEVARKGHTLLKVSVAAALTTFIPVLKDKYKEIFEEDREAIRKIKSDYAQYYDATWEALKHDDILIAAFMFRPDLFLTYGFAKHAPKVAAGLLSIFTGGVTDKYVNAAKEKFQESLVKEDKHAPNMLTKLTNNQKVVSLMSNNENVEELSSQGQEATKEFLSSLFEQAKIALSAKTIEEFEKVTKTKLGGLDELKNLDPQKKKEAENIIFQAAKKKIKDFYQQILLDRISKVTKFGISNKHPFVTIHQAFIKKIEAL
jgi:hypothetical protein